MPMVPGGAGGMVVLMNQFSPQNEKRATYVSGPQPDGFFCGVKSQIQAAVRPTTFRGSTRVERSIHFLQSPHLNAHYQMRRQP